MSRGEIFLLRLIASYVRDRVHSSSVLLVVHAHLGVFGQLALYDVPQWVLNIARVSAVAVREICFGRESLEDSTQVFRSFPQDYNWKPGATGSCKHCICDSDADLCAVAELDYSADNDHSSNALPASDKYFRLLLSWLALLLKDGSRRWSRRARAIPCVY